MQVEKKKQLQYLYCNIIIVIITFPKHNSFNIQDIYLNIQKVLYDICSMENKNFGIILKQIIQVLNYLSPHS